MYKAVPLCLLFVVAIAAQETTFRSQSNVVVVPALVRDETGSAVYGLHEGDFVIEDDGVEQIVHLDQTAEAEPLSLVVAIQSGRRAKREFPRIQGLKSMLGPIFSQPGSQIAIVVFDSTVNLVQDFTSDPKKIETPLQSLHSGDGGAVILDAVTYSVRLLDKVPEGRQRALLLISETRDHGSHWATVDDVVKLIGNTNTAMYALTFSPGVSNVLDTGRGTNRDEMGAVPDILAALMLARAAMRNNIPKAIAFQSGGEYELFETRSKFESHMVDFTNHLHSRYVLSFEPSHPHSGLHQIRVRLKQPAHMTVLARSSYWAEGASE